MKRTLALAVLPMTLAMTVASGLTTQAQAVTLHWSSGPYGNGFSTFSQPLDKCVTVNVSGTLEYRWWRKMSGRKDMWIDRVRVKNPQMEMIVRSKCNRQGVSRKLTGAKLSQLLYDQGCKTSTAVTVSVPWAVGVTPTRKCGRIKTAKRSSSYNARSSTYYQFNTGRPATFKPKGLDAKPYPGHKEVCLHVDVTATAYEKSISDSFGKDLKLCVKVFN
ncbi:hypothetical protein ABT126_10120 [Streptomyces sp. NPDC002012]|uniref:hypothetical protein n=1 Tax=unclassified Streptomyces TaxID=2593676 RepID=UPI002E130B5E|nr:hypothetical protein OG609_13245 [Streptomyces sp. NBC_01224]